MDVVKTDICVIGGGSGGLSVAAGAVQMGADTVLVEGGKMGGDCLNYGCVPSKALIAAAKKAVSLKTASAFGVTGPDPVVDYPAVMDHVREVIAGIEPHDSVERFEELGVKVLQGYGEFISPERLRVGDQEVQARRFVIATGSAPAAPPIPGLDQVHYLTNETLFDNREQPEHLAVIGGGPIGMELAQAHARFGCQVTVLEAFTVLAKDDPELTAVVKEAVIASGVDIREKAKISSVRQVQGGGYEIDVGLDGQMETLKFSHLLVATGRKPNVDRLGLDAAGIQYSSKGIEVNQQLKTSNRRVFAIGDVIGGYQFTHMAGYHAGIVIRNALFRLPAKVNYDAVPWVTYTDPELANVGLSEDQAREKFGNQIRVLEFSYAENDRARAERLTTGKVKAITDHKGKILGAAIVGAQAGELIQSWGLAITGKLKISAMASYISPYPTLSEINKRAAGSYYTPKLFSDKTRKIVRFLSLFG